MPAQDGMSWTEFRELLKERTQEFVRCDLTEDEFRRFLARNAYTATGIEAEIRDAKTARLEYLRTTPLKHVLTGDPITDDVTRYKANLRR